MSDINPYQSPRYYDPEVPVPAEAAEPGEARDVWRQGNLLVMRKGTAELPDRCVFSNEPARGFRIKRTYYWHPPELYLALFAFLIGYLLLTPFFGHKIVVHLPASPKREARRRRGSRWGWALALVGLVTGWVMAILGLPAEICVAVGIGLVVTGIIVEATAHQLKLTVARVRDDFVWLKGVHPDYLAELPEWPGG